MKYRVLTTTVLAAALVTGHVGRASADIGEVIVGGIIGGVVAGAINDSRRGSRTTTRTVVVDSAARQLARDIQRALNYFNWHVGAADGVLGQNSRNGIRSYQMYLGFAGTGQLTDMERNILLTAHQRAEMGGAQVTRVTTRHRDGVRGLLEVVRDEMMGGGGARLAGAYGLPGEVADFGRRRFSLPPAETDDDVGGIVRLDLEEIAVVHDLQNQFLDIVGLVGIVGD